MSSVLSLSPVSRLLHDFSIEMTAKDIAALGAASDSLPPRTRVNVTFLGNETDADRLAAARAVQRHGLTPVPHLAARRLASPAQLEGLLGALRDEGLHRHLFVIGGDPRQAEGPYASALDLVAPGTLARFGVASVGIGGYPEGHPDIGADALWAALGDKAAVLTAQQIAGDIVTQFSFDPDAVLAWLAAVRRHGITLPVRIGVPGPAGIKRLLAYAARFGVGSSVGIARKYGLSLGNLLSTVGPDRFLNALAQQLDPAVHGDVKLHFYAFGGLKATADWIRDFAAAAER